MARILDFYAVRWEYEPHTFPILWSLDGSVVESFAPDFYLPDLDLYLEMTTLKQRLVRKKNRKLRRLRELYPDLRIKLFYARDFRMLMLKYGKLALLDSLSGTPGQVVPVRIAESATTVASVVGPPAASATAAAAPLVPPPDREPEPVPAMMPPGRTSPSARSLAGAARPRRRRRSQRATGGPGNRR